MLHTSPAAVLLAFALTIFASLADAVVVTNTTDVGGAGCAATGTGPCSLRDAITFTNSSGGGTISFNIPGSGVQTIAPLSALPAITAATMIDGYSQPGSAMNTATIQNGTNAVLMIEIDLTHTSGMVVTGNSAVVQGLVINRSFGPGITISGNNVQVLGSFIGTNPAGTAPGPGNGGDGIAAGGIGDVIGGNTDAARNLISGNHGAGVRVSGSGVMDAVVSNNLIGTNAAGTAALANLAQGVVISGQGHLVGLGATSQGNVISGNVSSGILVATALVSATIAGNNIGANAAGTAPLGNGTGGVTDGITVNSSFVLVGGATVAEGNVIGGSAVNGILVNGNSNQIFNNRIGLLPNGGANGNANAGISVHPFSNNNKIGGGGKGNTITNSGGNGVEVLGAGVTGGTGNDIRVNSIFGNAGLGIKLGSGNSPTPNDLGDADTGPNNLQNYPVITGASVSGGLLILGGTLNSLANHVFNVAVYSSTSCDPSGSGEGQTYLGEGPLMTDGSGNIVFGGSLAIPPGQLVITATATDNVDGSTSEFSQCFGPPALVNAVSRKVHGGAGKFDLPLSPGP
jgi:hypothetical protein